MSQILKERANEAFKQQKYQEADDLYRDSIILDPENPVLYSNRAMSSIKLSNWKVCIEICDSGLSHSPDPKTKVKLLWRRGTAYSKLNEFTKSRDSYYQALLIDSKNLSVLRSIDELNREENQFKRSHSIGEFEAEKRPKITSVEKIPIYEVDELPKEFLENPSNETPKVITPTPTPTRTATQLKETKTPPSDYFTSFPEIPTAYQLTSIIKSNDGNPDAYKYLISLPPSLYKKLYQGGNIDGQFLNFLLDSIIYILKGPKQQEPDALERLLELMRVFANVPRFGLAKLFLEKSKLEEISELTTENFKSTIELWL